MKLCIIAALVATIFGQPGTAVAADIFVGGMRWTGIPAIWIRGQIVPGDERTFAVVAAKRQASVVYLSSEGGEVAEVLFGQAVISAVRIDKLLGGMENKVAKRR